MSRLSELWQNNFGLGPRTNINVKPGQQNKFGWGYGGSQPPEPAPAAQAGPSAGDPLGRFLARKATGATENPIRGFSAGEMGGLFGGATGGVGPAPYPGGNSLGFSVAQPVTPNYQAWQGFVSSGQAPIYRPSTESVTGAPYLNSVQAGLSAQAINALDMVQRRFERNRERLRATLASQGILDSGVGAQAEADLLAEAQAEMNRVATDLNLQKTQAFQEAHQQAIDNAFKLSGLDLDINKLGLDRDQLAHAMALDDAQFTEWARNAAAETGVNIAKLFDAHNQWKSDLAMRQQQLEQEAAFNQAQLGLEQSKLAAGRQNAAASGSLPPNPTQEELRAYYQNAVKQNSRPPTPLVVATSNKPPTQSLEMPHALPGYVEIPGWSGKYAGGGPAWTTYRNPKTGAIVTLATGT